jgi:hypothetical protein
MAAKEGALMIDDDDKAFQGAPALGKALGMALDDSRKKTLRVDTAKYAAVLDDPELTYEQKEQIIEALWCIIICFVDLGYGVAPLQEACGKLPEITDECGKDDPAMVRSKPDTLSERFKENADE